MSCRVTVVDAYDSFVHILVSYFEQLDCQVTVLRKDDPKLLSLVNPVRSDMIVLGPGPGHPGDSGYGALLRKNAGQLPVLGVCLGHQAIGLHYNATIEYATHLMHGKTSIVEHDGRGCYAALTSRRLKCMRYHSIIVADKDLPGDLVVTSRSIDDGYIMGLRHKTLPIESVQFHPESIGTEDGLSLIRNFINTYVFENGVYRYARLQQ